MNVPRNQEWIARSAWELNIRASDFVCSLEAVCLNAEGMEEADIFIESVRDSLEHSDDQLTEAVVAYMERLIGDSNAK